VLTLLLAQCSLKQAVSLAVEITGAKKKLLYQKALEINGAEGEY
jgi:16S rRNA (cytidine1402-2'-O)-methyltransferase